MTYRQIRSGGGLLLEPGDQFDFACCDCGLVHTVSVEHRGGLQLGVLLERNTRGTNGVRRGKAVRARLEALVMGWLRK